MENEDHESFCAMMADTGRDLVVAVDWERGEIHHESGFIERVEDFTE